MASQSNVRDTTNLINYNGPHYSPAKRTALIDWLKELKEKDNVLTLPSGRNRGLTLLKNNDFRIDYQGHFTSDPYQIGWINLQVQENTPRKPNTSTTVITTFVHYQGYHQSQHITSRIILRVMIQQIMHIFGEHSIFVCKTEEGAVTVKNIPRSPQCLLSRGWGSLAEVRRVQGEKEWNDPKMKGKWAAIWVPGS